MDLSRRNLLKLGGLAAICSVAGTSGLSCAPEDLVPLSKEDIKRHEQIIKIQKSAKKVKSYISGEGYIYDLKLDNELVRVNLSQDCFKQHRNLLKFTYKEGDIRIDSRGRLMFNETRKNDLRAYPQRADLQVINPQAS
jgi:hypothetical protein